MGLGGEVVDKFRAFEPLGYTDIIVRHITDSQARSSALWAASRGGQGSPETVVVASSGSLRDQLTVISITVSRGDARAQGLRTPHRPAATRAS
jgi:hypothetical protein